MKTFNGYQKTKTRGGDPIGHQFTCPYCCKITYFVFEDEPTQVCDHCGERSKNAEVE